MAIQPVELKLASPNELLIQWSDGETRIYPIRELRDACPCAVCIEKRSADRPAELLPVLTVAETQPLRITRMEPKGNYAYAIHFSDGHDSGIFTLELLKSLGAVQH